MGKDTHYEECWRDRKHHDCAVAEIERLRELLREARDNFVADMTEAEWEMRVREALGERDD